MPAYLNFTCLLVASFFFCLSSNADDSTTKSRQAILVLDASGSMWGQLSGKTKIEIARNVTREILRDLDPGVELGLIAYGHRRKGDCGDIEFLLPPGSGNRKQFIATVEKLKPKGKTPLSDAVVKAAEQLRYTEKAATVILVSDGIETCDKDPCEVGRALEEAGVDFTTHVVGFDLSKKEERQLHCLADSTGGAFLSASDADSLKSAMSEAIESVSKSTDFNLQLEARQVENGPLLGHGVSWRIYNSTEAGDKLIEEFFAVRPRRQLPPGEYRVEGIYNDIKAEKNITIQETEILEETLLFGSGTVRIRAFGGGEDTEIKDPLSYKILQQGKIIYQALGSRRERDLPVGKYEIQAEYGGIVQKAEAEVKSGELTEVSLIFNAGRLEVLAIPRPGGKSFGRAMHWELLNDGAGDESVSVKRFGSALRGKFPAGAYRVRVRFAGMITETGVVVESGKSTSSKIVIPAGRVSVSALIGGQAVSRALNWKLSKLEKDKEEILITTLSKKFIRDLPLGDYIIVGEFDGQTASAEISVKAGEESLLKLELEHPH